MRSNEDRTGNDVEKSELSFDSLGEDDGDDDAEGHDGENDPEGSHTMVGDGFSVNVEGGKVACGRGQSGRVRVVRVTVSSRVGRMNGLGDGESAGSGSVALEELHDD